MDDCQKNNAPTAESRIPSKEDLPNVEHITQTITELNTCRKIVLMYPPKHVQVQRGLKQACDVLNQVLSAQSDLIIGIAKNTLLIGGKPLDPKNTICKDFAITLMQLEVAAIKFISGVTSEELLGFLLLIAERPEDIHAKGGIQKVSLDCNLSKIQIQAIDYEKFQFTEEAEITDAHKLTEHTAKTDIWQNYIVHLISGTLTESDDGKSLSEFGEVDPIQIAELLNQNQIDLNVVLESYRDVLKNKTAQLRARHAGNPPSNQIKENPNPADSPSAQAGNLQNLNQLLHELNPDLRRQFLAVTFQQCSTEDASNWTDEFLNNFSEDLIVDMLRQENKEDREISPTLQSFIKKFSNSGPGSAVNDPADNQSTPHISAENLQGIFKRKSCEDCVDSESGTRLKELTREEQSDKTEAKEELSVENILESLEDSPLCTQIAMLLLAFMKNERDHEKYKAYGAKLVETGNELLEAGHFSLLKRILNTIDQQCRDHVTSENRTAAKELIETWQSPAFTSKAVQTIFGSQDRIDPQGYEFLLALGPKIVPDLVNLYGKQKTPESDGTLFKLLTKFKAEAANEAQKRLRDTRPEYVCNMVVFLRRINAHKALPQLRPLMEKSSTSVQMEVLVALLKFDDGWAAYHLRKSLQSDRADIAALSIAMAAKYKVKDIVPDLMAMLKTRVMFKPDFQKNEELIDTLGQIGDTAAIPSLAKLAKSGGFLHQEEHLHMKQVLFNSLQGYPLDAVSSLLKIGQNSKEKSIRDACHKILTKAN
jgi:hypothetical protein